jgi:hypothetical protein
MTHEQNLEVIAMRRRIARQAAGAALLLLGLLLLAGAWFYASPRVLAQSEHACSSAFKIDKTLPTGTRWEMCWEPRALDGIVLYDITLTPPGEARRLILAQAGLAQVHVPYDDNGARFHDVTDFGFGGRFLENLTPAECPDGVLLPYGGKNVICMQVQPRGYAQKYYARQLQGYELSLFSVSTSGDYNYIVQWEFYDDGTIVPTVGASGQLQRYGTDAAYGWVTATNRIPISHYHNYWFRLDFDINGRANDLVQEIQINPTDQNRRRVKQLTDITFEAARQHDSTVQRSWRVLDKVTHNDGGNLISYQIEGLSSGHDFTGPDFEPFSHNDLYVTTFKTCEKYPSHNPALNGCANDVSQFVNGESVDGADLVVWYGITFHHLPREEDEVYMDVHWDGFTIIPRDWTSHNPLDSVSGGGTAATATPSPTPTEPPPALEVKPQAVVLMAESLPQTVTLRLETTGDAPIPWQAQSGTAWLVASPLSGTAPTTLTLQVAPPGTSSLLTGTVYTGTVTVSSKLTTAVQPALQVEVTVLRGMTETNYIPLIEAGGP